MAILTDNLQRVQEQFGEPLMAQKLIDGNIFQDEKAYEYSVGDFRMIAGFYQGVCRYACFLKGSLDVQAFTPEDVKTCLMLIAPLSAWTGSSDEKAAAGTGIGTKSAHPVVIIGSNGTTTDYQCEIKDSDGNEAGVLAWHHTSKAYFFAYCPSMPFPQPAIAVGPMQIDKTFP